VAVARLAGVSTAQAAPPPPAAVRRRGDLVRAYRYPLIVFVASRVLAYGLMGMEAWTSRAPAHSPLTYDALFSPLSQWDAVWYGWIADHGYDPAVGHGNAAAFFPLFPLIWGVAERVLPGPDTLLASLLSTALFGAALLLLWRITLGRFGEAMARRTVLYLAIFPLTFVFSLPYSESLFLLLSLAAFAATWYGRWWLGAAAGALAVLTRPVGIALVPALAWRRWRTGARGVRPYLPLLLPPAAELAFFTFLFWRTGDPLAHLHAQERGWERGFSFLPWLVLETLWTDVLSSGHLRFLVHIAFVLLWLGLWFRAFRMRLPGEYLLYAALLVLIPTSGGLLVSVGRFGMVAFPLFWALADLGRDERVDTAVKIAFPALMAALVFVTFGARTFTP
jgi:hypothetical protein